MFLLFLEALLKKIKTLLRLLGKKYRYILDIKNVY
jgi:hypothetical protein